MSPQRKAHVVERRWSVGAFHIDRNVQCRCGEIFTHYNAAEALALFKQHQTERESAA